VAITRTEEYLMISFARSRVTYGTLAEQTASRFIDELRGEKHDVFDLRESTRAERSAFFWHWFSGTKIKPVQKIVPEKDASGASKSLQTNSPAALHGKKFTSGKRVSHAIFGMGLIERVDQKGEHQYITVKFSRGGIKIIQDQFLKIL
jgi:hypothetical protein